MNFDDSYFLAEERDGFYVKSMMKRFWASSLESLAEIDRICKKNNIKYFAYFGTMLGAVRHKGFIPWDDDLDIAMLRVDYERFIKCVQKDLQAPFMAYNLKENNLIPMRIFNSTNTCLDEAFLKRFHLCPYLTGVDIYVLDKIPQNVGEQNILKILHQTATFLSQRTDAEFSAVYEDEAAAEGVISTEDIEFCINEIENLTGYSIDRNKELSPQLTLLTHALAASYYDTDATKVVQLNKWSDGISDGFDISLFDEMVDMPFENMMLPVPTGYHEILTGIYGDNYMTPIRDGFSLHDYPAYKQHEEELFSFLNANNIPIPSFLTI